MPNHASQEQDQSALYLDLINNYPVISREQWDHESALQRKWYQSENRDPDTRPPSTPWDYLLLATLDGVEYWLPNDEDWFDIMAVDHTNKLAIATGFCEMYDFTYEESDYRFVMDPSDNQLKCKFQIGR